MSDADARRAGILPPLDYRAPPPASLADGVRTAVVFGSLVPAMIAAAAERGASSTDPPPHRGPLARRCRRLLARLGIDVQVEAIDAVPRQGGLVFMWNQASHLDHLILPLCLPRPFATLFNNEVRATPLYGAYLERNGHFWVDRKDEAQWRPAIARAAASVRDGGCILISPEGTRSWDGRLLPMKRGAFLLARQAERPIVCVTIAGAGDRLPRGQMAVRPGPVRVRLCSPIPVRADDPDLEERVRVLFEHTLAELATASAR